MARSNLVCSNVFEWPKTNTNLFQIFCVFGTTFSHFFSADTNFFFSLCFMHEINTQKLSFFLFLCSRFALSFDNIGGISAKNTQKLSFFLFLCSRFALSLQKQMNKEM